MILFALLIFILLYLVHSQESEKKIMIGKPDTRMPSIPHVKEKGHLIVIINLERNRERMNETYEAAKKLFPTSTIVRMEGIEMEKKYKTAAILKSHLQALRIAHKSGCREVLILEDDTEFTEKAGQFLKPDVPYDVYMLGNYIFSWGPIERSDYRRLYKASTASAYQVKRAYMPELINLYSQTLERTKRENYQDQWTNDYVWFSLQERDVWIGPPQVIANQRVGWCALRKDYVNNQFHISPDGEWGYKTSIEVDGWKLNRFPEVSQELLTALVRGDSSN